MHRLTALLLCAWSLALAGQATHSSLFAADKTAGMSVKSVSLELVAGKNFDFDKLRGQVEEVCQPQGATVAREEVTAQPPEKRRGTWALRVPVANLDRCVASLEALGTLRSTKRTSEDITSRGKQLSAEVTNLEAQEQVLRAAIQAEKEVKSASPRSSDLDHQLEGILEKLKQRKADLERRREEASFATIYLTLLSPASLETPMIARAAALAAAIAPWCLLGLLGLVALWFLPEVSRWSLGGFIRWFGKWRAYQLTCAACKSRLDVPAKLAGQLVKCPICAAVIDVPDPTRKIVAVAVGQPCPPAVARPEYEPEVVGLTCPGCKSALKPLAQLAGKRIRCPVCSTERDVPAAKA